MNFAFDIAKNIFDRQTTQDQWCYSNARFADVVDDQGIKLMMHLIQQTKQQQM